MLLKKIPPTIKRMKGYDSWAVMLFTVIAFAVIFFVAMLIKGN